MWQSRRQSPPGLHALLVYVVRAKRPTLFALSWTPNNLGVQFANDTPHRLNNGVFSADLLLEITLMGYTDTVATARFGQHVEDDDIVKSHRFCLGRLAATSCGLQHAAGRLLKQLKVFKLARQPEAMGTFCCRRSICCPV